MFYDILDKKRIDILPLFNQLKKDFYLAGGTALALQIGHRDSIDFDFFTENNIDTVGLFGDISEIFKDYKVLKIQEEKNTLSVLIGDSIKLSFFTCKYKLLNGLIDESHLKIASVEDIGCMKLSAITGRASNKDYIDLYYILQNLPLKDLLTSASKKFPDLDRNLILKSIIYFEDIDEEQIMFKNNKEVNFGNVKRFLIEKVRELYKN